MSRFFPILLCFLCLAFASGAQAAAVNGSITNSSTVASECVLKNNVDIGFGKYTPMGANKTAALDATGSVTISCTYNSSVQWWLDYGTYSTSCILGNNLRMRSAAGGYINYSIYQDSGRSTYLSLFSAACGGGKYGLTAPGPNGYIVNFYGRIAAGQTSVGSGTYNDTLTFTVSF